MFEVSQYRLWTSVNLRSAGAADPPGLSVAGRDGTFSGRGAPPGTSSGCAARAGPGSNSGPASSAAPRKSAARCSTPARASGPSNSWRTTPNANSCSRSLPRPRSTFTPACSAMPAAACSSAVFPIPAGPPMITSPPAPPPACRIASCIRRSSGSRSSSMSVRRPSTNPVSPPGRPHAAPSSIGKFTASLMVCTYPRNRFQPRKCRHPSASRPCGRSKLSAGRTATRPLGLIIG